VDVEGLRQGIQEDLIMLLAEHSPCPVTYAGGVHRLSDLDRVKKLGMGRVDLTIGSALDIFGGTVPFAAVLQWQGKNS
jgi:phosphoribosylformimino-5-aminoimidazole carboxamide ribotide isomerase